MGAMLAALRLSSFVWDALREGIALASRHTGVPAVLVAAVAIVACWRLGRRAARFAAETALVCAGLIALTALGWIRF